jgi:hypothetical protein
MTRSLIVLVGRTCSESFSYHPGCPYIPGISLCYDRLLTRHIISSSAAPVLFGEETDAWSHSLCRRVNGMLRKILGLGYWHGKGNIWLVGCVVARSHGAHERGSRQSYQGRAAVRSIHELRPEPHVSFEWFVPFSNASRLSREAGGGPSGPSLLKRVIFDSYGNQRKSRLFVVMHPELYGQRCTQILRTPSVQLLRDM